MGRHLRTFHRYADGAAILELERQRKEGGAAPPGQFPPIRPKCPRCAKRLSALGRHYRRIHPEVDAALRKEEIGRAEGRTPCLFVYLIFPCRDPATLNQ